MSIRFWIEEWHEYDGVLLPRRAHRDSELWRTQADGQETSTRARVTYAREGANFGDQPSTEWQPAFSIGHGIKDDRTDMQYRLGARQAYIDGQTLPLLADAAFDLFEVAHTISGPLVASPVDGVAPTTAPAPVVPPPDTTRSWSLKWILLGALVVSAGLVVAGTGFKRSLSRRMPLGLLGVIAVAGLFILLYTPKESEGEVAQVLQGERRHDFGNVVVGRVAVKLEHVFALENTTRDNLEVLRVVSGCGCLVPGELPQSIRPGDTIRVPVAFSIASPGYRTADVSIVIKGMEPITLSVCATGYREADLTIAQRSLLVKPKEHSKLFMIARANERPDAPELLMPAGTRATFGGWFPVMHYEPVTKHRTRWHGIVDIESDGPLPPDAHMTVHCASETASINLAGRPWCK
jgi:hypothetical protein